MQKSFGNLLFLILLFCKITSYMAYPPKFNLKYGNHLDRIKIRGRHFVDEYGRVILFRGINGVEKQFPWLPNQNAQCNLSNITQLENLKKWGFNGLFHNFFVCSKYF